MQRVLELLSPLSLWAQVVVILVGSLVVAKSIELIGRWLAKSFDTAAGSVRRIVFQEVYVPLYVSVFLFGVLLALRAIGISAFSMLGSVVLSLIVVLWSRAGIRIGAGALEEVKEHENRYDFAPVLKNIWSVAVVGVAGISLLVIWNIDIAPLLASAGLAGVVLGFAARDAIANFVGGVALYFDDTYKLGDFIVLESGEKGTVVDIGLRSTALLTRDRVMITIPNSVLNSSHVINESAPKRYKRVSIPVYVAYDSDIEQVEDLLLAVADDVGSVMQSPAPEVSFQGFGDSALEYELRVFVSHPLREPQTIHRINREIYRRFADHGITIPYPQRDITLNSTDSDVPPSDLEDAVPKEYETE